jgi:hypothetical protein
MLLAAFMAPLTAMGAKGLRMSAATMRIEFCLRALGEIAPWHDGDGSNPHLGWFGLSDGWYWIALGEVEFFRYSQAILDKWAQEAGDEPWFARTGGLPYVDYHVAQLWGDLLDFLPDVLAPVPPRLVQALANGAWARWEQEAEAALEEAIGTKSLDKSEAISLLYEASRWLGKRTLDSAYLVAGPNVHCWSDGAQVYIQWANRDRTLYGLPAWEATAGQLAMPPAAFREAISDFNTRFMRRMADRVAIAQVDWTRPEVALAPHLSETHVGSERWSQEQLAATAPREMDDWDRTFAGIARVEALPRFTSGTAQRLA